MTHNIDSADGRCRNCKQLHGEIVTKNLECIPSVVIEPGRPAKFPLDGVQPGIYGDYTKLPGITVSRNVMKMGEKWLKVKPIAFQVDPPEADLSGIQFNAAGEPISICGFVSSKEMIVAGITDKDIAAARLLVNLHPDKFEMPADYEHLQMHENPFSDQFTKYIEELRRQILKSITG